MQKFSLAGAAALRFMLAALLWCSSWSAVASESLDGFPRVDLEIATPDARIHRFKAWVADTEARRQQGLMFVKSLPDDAGMLFIFPQAAQVSFWMKNTFVPLDMLFIRADGRIDSVAADAVPLSTKTIESKSDRILAVLEIRGGLAKKLGIGAGAAMVKPSLAD